MKGFWSTVMTLIHQKSSIQYLDTESYIHIYIYTNVAIRITLITALPCLQVMQHEMRQKSEGQAVLMEILKLRKEMDDRFRALPPGGAVSTVVGMAEMGSGEGAVGGVSLGRNVFSTALDESEQATSKLKGKEEVGENETTCYLANMNTGE